MHGAAHVLTGWLIGHYFKGSLLENTLLAVLAVVIDADGAKLRFFDATGCIHVEGGIRACAFAHAVFTHTLVWCCVVIMIVLFSLRILKGPAAVISTVYTLTPSIVTFAVVSHLFLDVWTYNKACGDTHQYLWPVSNFAFHLNCIFGSGRGTDWVRALGEWLVYHPLIWAIVAWRTVVTATKEVASLPQHKPKIDAWRRSPWKVAFVIVFMVAPVVYSFDPFGDGGLCIPWLYWLFYTTPPVTTTQYIPIRGNTTEPQMVTPPDDNFDNLEI